MKNGWVTKTLEEICIVVRGSSPRPIKVYLTDNADGVNWVKIGDTKGIEKYIEQTKQRITPKGAECSRKVEPGDLLLSNSMSFGKPYVMATNGYVHDGWFVLRNFVDTFDPDFFYLLLTSELVQSQFRKLAAGAVVKNISSDLVKKAILPVPPLPEQRRIVGILDEAFAGIATAKANAEKNLQNAHALFESHLNTVFTQRGEGWVETTIGEQIRFIDYRGKTPKKTEGGLRLITAKNVKMGYLQETPSEYVAPESYDAWMTRGIPQRGDVLFTTEAPLANVAQLDTDDKVVFAQRIIVTMQFRPFLQNLQYVS